MICDQPNIVTESGTRPSLDPHCKHQITFCKLNYLIPPTPSYWHYKKASSVLIQRSMRELQWEKILYSNHHPNWQVKCFNSTLLNMSNFVPSALTKLGPRDPPWITEAIKRMIKKQGRQNTG